jgi:hypothetical protein
MTVQKILSAALAMALLAVAQTQPTAAELLQKGIYAQDTAGDLDGAIKIYRQLVDSHPQQREIGAQAQYRLGMTLLAKGDTNAASQEIQRLGWDYPDYKDLMDAAKRASPLRVVLQDGKTFFFSAGPGHPVPPLELLTAERADRENAKARTADHEALFDWNRTTTVTGALVQITALPPYMVLVINSGTTAPPLRIYLASENTLLRAGWTHDTLKVGDRITVTGAPAIDGSGALQATEVNLNGKVLFSRPAVAMPEAAVGAYEK